MKKASRMTIAALGLTTFHFSAATCYVWQDSPSPAPPCTNWAPAAYVIQDAEQDSAGRASNPLATARRPLLQQENALTSPIYEY
jgi:hypothetical protein